MPQAISENKISKSISTVLQTFNTKQIFHFFLIVEKQNNNTICTGTLRATENF